MSSDRGLGAAAAAVRAAATAPAGELPDAAVLEELIALRRVADLAEAGFLQRLRVFDTRGIGEDDGLSTRAWLADRLHVAPGEAARMLKLARGLDGLPETSAALADGSIRAPHAAAMVDAVTLLGHQLVAEAETVLVDAARSEEPSRLRAALRGFGAAIDHPRAIKDAERKDQGRWLDLATTLDGVVSVSGILGPEDGAIVKTAIETLTTPAGPADSRTSTQRRADALVELSRRQLDSGTLPTVAGERPHLTVVTTLETIEERSGGAGETTDGTILSGATVRRLACDAKITRLIVRPDSMPLDVGRSQRTVMPWQHKALRVRDRGCRFPGCGRPVEWCDAHHINFWGSGGRTDVHELVLLCRKHHTVIHRGTWRVALLGPGKFRFITPDGEIKRAHPARSATQIIARTMALDDDHHEDAD